MSTLEPNGPGPCSSPAAPVPAASPTASPGDTPDRGGVPAARPSGPSDAPPPAGPGGGVLAGLLPDAVVAEESFGDPDQPPELFPEEERHVARAVEVRRREFGTVRALARTALARLGCPRVPLLPGERGAPTWPAGFVGSMTHCRGYRAAAVARATELVSVGIDAEPNEPLPDPGILDTISLPAERPRLATLAAARPDVSWERLLFSAKESVYKTWFPLTRRWLGFEEADIDLRPDGTFTARLLVAGPVVNGTQLDTFTGRWLSHNGLVFSAIAVPSDRG